MSTVPAAKNGGHLTDLVWTLTCTKRLCVLWFRVASLPAAVQKD